MIYCLKHFDSVLLKFSANAESSEPDYQILWVDESKRDFLPLTLELSSDGLERWIKHRSIPKNRAYVQIFLAKCGLSFNRPMNIIAVSKGLSLNDCYWIVEEEYEGTFADNNLYDNRFSNVLAELVFTGYGNSIRTSLLSSPEFTTNGVLPKCWRRIQGRIQLYKGGTSGADNAGYGPYSEYYACQIAEIMGINAISYNLSKWKGNLCSTCDLFTSKELSYIPVGYLKTKGGMTAVREYYTSLGKEYTEALDDMIVFDALICNTDRHFGNFGVLVNNYTNQIVAPAPLFDHGNSLFHFAWKDDWASDENLEAYISTLQPCVYDDFLESAKTVLAPRHREKLHQLLEFRFKRHSRYNLPQKRLGMIERQIQKRAGILLSGGKS